MTCSQLFIQTKYQKKCDKYSEEGERHERGNRQSLGKGREGKKGEEQGGGVEGRVMKADKKIVKRALIIKKHLVPTLYKKWTVEDTYLNYYEVIFIIYFLFAMFNSFHFIFLYFLICSAYSGEQKFFSQIRLEWYLTSYS